MNKALAVALIAALAASGCASNENARASRERNPAPCPNVIVLNDASRLVDFDGEPALDNVAYTAEIVWVELNCRYYGDRPIEASMNIDMAFGRGPKGEAPRRDYAYFVAVTRKDVEVIAKQEFIVPVQFGDSRAIRTVQEKIGKIVIPRANEETSGANFEVIVGLVLTPDQVVYNRSGTSLKFPNLQ